MHNHLCLTLEAINTRLESNEHDAESYCSFKEAIGVPSVQHAIGKLRRLIAKGIKYMKVIYES